MYPLITTVQIKSLLYIEFITEHNLYNEGSVEIIVPPLLKLPAVDSKIDVTPLEGSTRAKEAFIKDEFTVRIENFVQVEVNEAPFTYKFGLSGIENQISAKDAGAFTITTYYRNSDGIDYVVDTSQSSTSFVATTGLLSADKDLEIDKPTNYADNAVYTFIFSENSLVPEGGYIRIDFPDDVIFDAEAILKVESCDPAVATCTVASDNERSIIIKTITQVEREVQVKHKLGGIKNARSYAPSGTFAITTFDTDSVSVIDIGFNKNVATSTAGDITFEPIGRESDVNGDINTYTFELTTAIPMLPTDVLKFTVPDQIVMNAGGLITLCTPKNPDDEIVCGISGHDVQITIKKLAARDLLDPADLTNYSQKLGWTMNNIANPASVQTSDGFQDIRFLTEGNYLISENKEVDGAVPVTNLAPGIIIDSNLFQDSLQADTNNNYTITFTPINALPAAGSIKLKYPE